MYIACMCVYVYVYMYIYTDSLLGTQSLSLFFVWVCFYVFMCINVSLCFCMCIHYMGMFTEYIRVRDPPPSGYVHCYRLGTQGTNFTNH